MINKLSNGYFRAIESLTQDLIFNKNKYMCHNYMVDLNEALI